MRSIIPVKKKEKDRFFRQNLLSMVTVIVMMILCGHVYWMNLVMNFISIRNNLKDVIFIRIRLHSCGLHITAEITEVLKVFISELPFRAYLRLNLINEEERNDSILIIECLTKSRNFSLVAAKQQVRKFKMWWFGLLCFMNMYNNSHQVKLIVKVFTQRQCFNFFFFFCFFTFTDLIFFFSWLWWQNKQHSQSNGKDSMYN